MYFYGQLAQLGLQQRQTLPSAPKNKQAEVLAAVKQTTNSPTETVTALRIQIVESRLQVPVSVLHMGRGFGTGTLGEDTFFSCHKTFVVVVESHLALLEEKAILGNSSRKDKGECVTCQGFVF